MMRCAGTNEQTLRPCQQRARWRVSGAGAITHVNCCRYHLVDFVEQITDGGVPAIVLQVGVQ